jgi:hypothetical protein
MRMVNFANWLCCEGELTYSIADVTPCLIVLTSDASLTVFYSTFPTPRTPHYFKTRLGPQPLEAFVLHSASETTCKSNSSPLSVHLEPNYRYLELDPKWRDQRQKCVTSP